MSIPAAAYVRMSTDKEEQEASPERQRTTISQLCDKEDYRIVEEYFDDGYTGTDANRPAFQRLLADAATGKFKVIVADSSSRISRMDPWDFVAIVNSALRRNGVLIHTVADGLLDWDDPFAFFKAGMRSQQDNDFSKKISHNVTSGTLKAAADGRHLGSTPYGYRSVKDDPTKDKCRRHLEIIESEAEIVHWIFHAYDTMELPLRGIAKQINAKGIKHRYGARWDENKVRDVLRNERYTGTQTYGKRSRGKYNRVADCKQQQVKHQDKGKRIKNASYIRVPGAHAAIVTREQFDRVQLRLDENRKHHKLPGAGGHVFTGMVICGGCGKSMSPVIKDNGTVRWRCQNKTGTCGTPSFSEQKIHAILDEMLMNNVFKENVLEDHIRMLTEKVEAAKLDVSPARIDSLRQEIKDAKRKLLKIPDDLQDEAISEIRERQAELERLEAQLKQDVDVGDLFRRTKDELKKRTEEFRSRLPEYLQIAVAHEDKEAAELLPSVMGHISGKARHRQALQSWLKKITIYWKRLPPNKYELLGIECETAWQDVQKWPQEVALLYGSVLMAR